MSLDQPDLFEEHNARTVFDQLLAQSRTYSEGRAFRDLLEFAVKMKQFAPFNAMLLHIQRPGLTFATSGHEWLTEFKRYPKSDARPLLILWPFAPVVFVYDVLDTEGEDLPEGIYNFYARGDIGQQRTNQMLERIERKGINIVPFEAGDKEAGSIQRNPHGEDDPISYRLRLNYRHSPPTQLVTIAHELGHMFLGHLGEDKRRRIPDRRFLSRATEEIEAELVAYLVARRTGVESASEGYLSSFIGEAEEVPSLELFQILRAVGQIETLLGLSQKLRFGATQVRGS